MRMRRCPESFGASKAKPAMGFPFALGTTVSLDARIPQSTAAAVAESTFALRKGAGDSTQLLSATSG